MASTGSSDAEEDIQDQSFSPKKVGRAAEYPEFAIIWSYLENFCELLRFPELSLDGLEDGFNSHSSRNENYRQLEFLYKKLLVKLHKNFRPEKWEKALLKVAKEQNMLSSWDLENFGYDELKVCTKLELFKMLLESQFDCNNKLKTEVNKNYEADELRLRPFGRDMDGLLYWFHMDECGGVRLYSTEEDEVENESWKLLASDLDELGVVVDYLALKSATNPKDIVMAKREEERKKEAANSKSKKGKKSKKAAVKEEDDDDNPCARCYSNVHPDSILLCDKCDAAYHTACLRPPLLNVPQGDWFCPFCQQLVLLERLKEKKTRLVARQKLRARQAKRLDKSGMNLSNILQGPNSDEEQIDTIRRSGRARKTVDYTFRDFDEEIKDAVEVDIKSTEMNGHPTGKPAFAVDRFYTGRSSSKPASRVGKRRSRRLKDLDSGSDTDSKYSDFDYGASSDDDRPKPPKRHVYLRRHIIEDDEEEDENEEDKKQEETTIEENGDKEKTEQDEVTDEGDRGMNEENSSKDVKEKESNDEPTEGTLTNEQEKAEKSSNDSRVSGKEGEEDTSSEKSGPTIKTPSLKTVKDSETNCKDNSEQDKVTPEEKKQVDDSNKKKAHSDQHKKGFLEVPGPQSKPPPLERISSPKIDPLLDSLGFGALASCFTSNERLPARPDPYGTLRSPTASRSPRSPLRPDPGFPTDRMGVSRVPSSPSSYPRVGADSRYSFPDYGQASSYGTYFGYNQSGLSTGTYPGSPPGRPPSYSISMAGSRQYPGYDQAAFSNRETSAFSQTPQSPSYNQSSTPAMTPFGNPLSTGYPTAYSDTGSRAGYYQSSNQGYDIPSKSSYSHPSQGYYPDDPFSAGMYLGNPTANPLPPGGINSWPTPPPGSGSYFPQSGMGQNRTGI